MDRERAHTVNAEAGEARNEGEKVSALRVAVLRELSRGDAG